MYNPKHNKNRNLWKGVMKIVDTEAWCLLPVPPEFCVCCTLETTGLVGKDSDCRGMTLRLLMG